MFKLVPLFLAAGLLAGAGTASEAARELKKFDGTWVLESGEKDGARLADEHVRAGKIVWDGGKVTVHTPHQSGEPIKADVTVDPAKRPGEMIWVRISGPHAGLPMLAVYEFLGPDRYRVCFAPPGKGRPKEFRTKAGSGHHLHVWKRVKAEGARPSRD